MVRLLQVYLVVSPLMLNSTLLVEHNLVMHSVEQVRQEIPYMDMEVELESLQEMTTLILDIMQVHIQQRMLEQHILEQGQEKMPREVAILVLVLKLLKNLQPAIILQLVMEQEMKLHREIQMFCSVDWQVMQ